MSCCSRSKRAPASRACTFLRHVTRDPHGTLARRGRVDRAGDEMCDKDTAIAARQLRFEMRISPTRRAARACRRKGPSTPRYRGQNRGPAARQASPPASQKALRRGGCSGKHRYGAHHGDPNARGWPCTQVAVVAREPDSLMAKVRGNWCGQSLHDCGWSRWSKAHGVQAFGQSRSWQDHRPPLTGGRDDAASRESTRRTSNPGRLARCSAHPDRFHAKITWQQYAGWAARPRP